MRGLAIAVWLLLATSARAQDRDASATAFEAAEKAFADEDYVEALRLFRRAFELAPHAAVRFNIAVCLERLGRFREAAVEYDAVARGSELDASTRERAAVEAARVRARLGVLVVEGEPAGARVRVDGAELCALPCRVAVDPGKRVVVVERATGPVRTSVEVPRDGVATFRVPAAIAPPAPEPRARPERRGPGPLTWIGAGVAVAGAAGTIGFGLRARDLHDDYQAMPTPELRDDGLRMRLYTNVSLGVTVAGAILAGIDLFVLSRR